MVRAVRGLGEIVIYLCLWLDIVNEAVKTAFFELSKNDAI